MLLDHLDLGDAALAGFSMGEGARYIGRYGIVRVVKAVLAAAAPPTSTRVTISGGRAGRRDDPTVLRTGRGDRIAFLDGFITNFLAAGDRYDLISEPSRLYHREVAEFASPKGTLDCIEAFSYTDFRDDLAKVEVPALITHEDPEAIVPFEVSGSSSHEAKANSSLALIEGGPHGVYATHTEQFNRVLLDFLG